MSTLTITRAFMRRDFSVAKSYRAPFVLELVGSLFALVQFYFVAKLVDDGGSTRFAELDGGYFPFVVIGLTTFRMLQTSLLTFTNQVRSEQTTGTLAALLTSPAKTSTVILGSAAYSIVRALISAGLMVGLSIAMGVRLDVTPASAAAALVTVVAAMVLFSAVGVVIAGFTIVFKQAAGLVGLTTAAISLLSGVFFPIEAFPSWLAAIARVVPVTWAVDLLRAQLLRGEVDAPAVLGMAVAGIVAWQLSLWAFGASVRQARRTGTLSQF